LHYNQINQIIEQFVRDITTPDVIGGTDDKLDIRTYSALNSLSNWLINQILSSQEAVEAGENLLPLLKNGTFTNLTNEIFKLRNEKNISKLENEIIKLSSKYTSKIKREKETEITPFQPRIIISESFV
jgi:hypothetical protein